MNDRYNASEQCWQLYGELSAYNMEKNDVAFIHQLSVDAYGAQHSGEATKLITTAFALIGLYLAFERGYTGRQVQRAHMELAKLGIDWPRFTPPERNYALTVWDVVQAEPGEPRDAKHVEWAKNVWNNWEHAHAWARGICERYLR